MAISTPAADSGPRAFVPPTLASSSVSSARMTVSALAAIAGPAERSAERIARCRSSCRTSSSR